MKSTQFKFVTNAVFLCLMISQLSCDWFSLAKNSLNYRETKSGEAANVIVYNTIAYSTAAQDGLILTDINSGEKVKTLLPPPGSESVDDLAVVGQLLFVLDARKPGHLSVYSLADPLNPKLTSAPVDVPVEPFSGVSASNGLCMVSGGTSELTVWRYDSAGVLGGPLAKTDLGRGQPDVILSSNETAYVSTHYWGPYFGLDVIKFNSADNAVEKLAEYELEGAGFTEGGAKPANFPIEMAFLGTATLLAAYAKGLGVFDISLPEKPELIELIDVGGNAVNVDVFEHRAAVAVSSPEPVIKLIDFDSGKGQIVKSFNLEKGTFVTSVALTADYVIAAAHDKGILRLKL